MKKNCRPCGATGYDQTDPNKAPWPNCTHCNGTGEIQIDLMGLVLRETDVSVHQ